MVDVKEWLSLSLSLAPGVGGVRVAGEIVKENRGSW